MTILHSEKVHGSIPKNIPNTSPSPARTCYRTAAVCSPVSLRELSTQWQTSYRSGTALTVVTVVTVVTIVTKVTVVGLVTVVSVVTVVTVD